MKLSKKWLAIAVVPLALVLAASIGGIAVLADNGSAAATAGSTTTTATTTPTTSPEQTLLDKIVADYKANTGTSLDETALQTAITQAQNEIRTADLQTRLDNEVAAGKLTQAQADQILAWYQAMPSILNADGGLGLLGCPGGGPGMGCFRP
jgi:ABC-type glycerol-3-phosphate transport system substrate-binding protein